MYRVILSRQAQKDARRIKQAGLDGNTKTLLALLSDNPYQNPPPYESLRGSLSGVYSRRINIKHRLTYTVSDEEKVVHALRMWTHYE